MIARLIMTLAMTLLLTADVYAQGNDESRYASHSRLATGKWVKIRVSKEGVYSISSSKLKSLGFNPDKVSLYGYNLPILPEANIENISDDLTEIPVWRRNDGSVLFYSFGTTKWQLKSAYSTDYTRINNPYSAYIYYFLTENEEGPKAMPKETLTIDSTNDSPITTFREHTLIEKDEISLLKSGRTFYESYDYANGNRKSYTLNTPGIADQKVALSVQFVASGSSASSVTITADDTTFTGMSFRAVQEYEFGVQVNKNVNWTKKLNETSTITLTHTRNSGTSGHLDYILACYTRRLDMGSNNYLAFHLPRTSASTIKLSGTTSNTHLFRITTPSTTLEMVGTTDGGTMSVAIPQSNRLEEYVAINVNASFPEPEFIGRIENQDLHALSNIDYVIIVPANGNLLQQAQRLADAHAAKDNLRCVVVRADQVYNEFSSGTPDATAYRRFMKMLYDKAETEADRPKNICLFGDGVWDNRMITSGLKGENPDNYLLCYESDNSLNQTKSFVLEEYYTLLEDGKGVSPLKEKPDCGVGRITAQTANQARGIVDKLISYINNEYAGAWKNQICMMADDGNSNIHMKDADSISNRMGELYPDYQVRKIYWDSYIREESGAGHSYNNAYKDIVKQVNDGALVMNYTGHGSAYILSHEQVLKRADFESWSSPRLPLWVHAACDVTPFDMNEETIGETALLNERGGAMGSITTTRTVYSSQNRIMNVNFMTHVLEYDKNGRKYTIGEALSMAKADIISGRMSERDSLNKCHFVLIGDPAIALSVPTYKAVIDTFNGKDMPQVKTDTIGAGAIISVTGHIIDEDGNPVTDFRGTVSPTIFDNLERVTCLNNAKDDISPYSFMTRAKTIYSGTDSVRNGKFAFSFPVPLDINYSDKTGLISLYAINTDKTIEANGRFEDFALGGTSPDIATNTEGPKLTISLNGMVFNALSDQQQTTDNTISIMATTPMHETPFFIGTIEDENGINAMGSSVGHDITLIIDNDPAMTYNLNSYLQYEPGSWTKGSVAYSIPELSEGQHTLLFRAWDMLNNPSSMEVTFDVVNGLKPNVLDLKINGPVRDILTLTIENDRPQSALNLSVGIYDMTGREVWRGGETNTVSSSTYYTYSVNLNETSGPLPPGIYICRASIWTANGERASSSKKFLVVAQ